MRKRDVELMRRHPSVTANAVGPRVGCNTFTSEASADADIHRTRTEEMA
jgi:hypothetical protein